MLKNYFVIGWRNLMKHKLFSFINIVGLGIAIPFSLLCLIQVVVVFEADNFHPYPGRTYRIITDVKEPNGSKKDYATSPFALSDMLKTDYPCVEKATRVVRGDNWGLTSNIKKINVNPIYVEPAFFEMFSFPLEKGTLPELPNTLVITHEMAEVFFGTENPVGKTLTHPDYGVFTVSGVLKPYKRGTHFRSDAMVSMATFKHFMNREIDLSAFTYVLVKPNSDEKNLDAALAMVAANTNKNISQSKQTFHYRSQLITDISPAFEKLENNAYVESYRDMAVNLAMAVAIILLAAFNYINLTLARSLSRAKEVGIRKVTGALRYQLVSQFVCEAVLIAFLALVAGYVILNLMKQFIHLRWITWEVNNNVALWTVFIMFTIFTGIIAGFFPARILSGFQPVKVLKGTISPFSFGKIGFRKSLVVIQLVATCCFVFLIASLFGQFEYMATDNENFNRKNIYNISTPGSDKLLKNDMAVNKNVEHIGLVSTPFGGTSATCFIKKDNAGQNSIANYYAANADFITNMNLRFVAGRNLPESTGDSATNFVVVNEKALFAMGLGTPREAIGKSIFLNNEKMVVVQGVVKDFCYSIYQFETQPLVMQYNPAQFQVLSIKTKNDLAGNDFKADMHAVWKKRHPYDEFSFSDYEKELYNRYYPGADMQFMGMISFVVFIISIMGLIGMVTYNTEKRLKEIGIRKVMGASVPVIINELSVGFLKLIAISGAICIPLGYIVSNSVINVFAFNDGVNFTLLLMLFCIIFLIALSTVIIKTGTAAAASPVKSLRTE
ncbi:MAG TPA: ABC transporter permease [Chitinophagaceae bacterium]|nr:ABC transporter permease [Chitinophagaceae bacterium]